MTAPTCSVPQLGGGAVSSEEFRSVFRRHPAGVAVVTLGDGERPVGFTATSVISVSAEPPLLAFSVAVTSSSWPALERTETLAINFLGADQVDVSARFATSGVDRFAGVGWAWLPTGEPVLVQQTIEQPRVPPDEIAGAIEIDFGHARRLGVRH